MRLEELKKFMSFFKMQKISTEKAFNFSAHSRTDVICLQWSRELSIYIYNHKNNSFKKRNAHTLSYHRLSLSDMFVFLMNLSLSQINRKYDNIIQKLKITVEAL